MHIVQKNWKSLSCPSLPVRNDAEINVYEPLENMK